MIGSQIKQQQSMDIQNTSHSTSLHVILGAAVSAQQAKQAGWRLGRSYVFCSDLYWRDTTLAYCGEQSDLYLLKVLMQKKKCPQRNVQG